MISRYSILLTEGASQDLGAIYDYIAEVDDPANADDFLDRLVATIEQLGVMPERGSYPSELLDLGIKDYRHVFSRPYRVIYRVMEREVTVFVIADGRRNMQSLLERRLLGV
ncbi:MAG: type II toxin-antitoxin system RelE/ParE family toxin [Gammaproteobacteria bacterium]